MKRTNIVLKHMVPFFYSHYKLSKYFVECIDYILKTELTLSPYMALKVRAATFVNMKGKQGKNKAADLQKENEVKYLKNGHARQFLIPNLFQKVRILMFTRNCLGIFFKPNMVHFVSLF